MSYEAGETRGVIDVWSRLMAIGSLVLAGATLYRSYLQSQEDPTRSSDLKAEILADTKSAVDAQLSTFEQRIATRESQDHASLRTELMDRFSEQDKQISALAAAPPKVPDQFGQGDTAGSSDPRRLADSPDGPGLGLLPRGPSEEPVTLMDANLVSTYVANSPGLNPTSPAVTLRNSGDKPALISVMEFIPEAVVDGVPATVYDAPLPEGNEVIHVETFTAADNLSTTYDSAGKERKQGKYHHRLATQAEVKPGVERRILLAIEDQKHVKYALKGKLIVTYNQDQTATFPDVIIPYVSTSLASRK